MIENEAEKKAYIKTKRNCKFLAILSSIMLVFTALEMNTHTFRTSLLFTTDALSKRFNSNNIPMFISTGQKRNENFAKERSIVANTYLDALKNSKSTYSLARDWNNKTYYFNSDWEKDGKSFFKPGNNNALFNENQKLAMVCDEIHNLMMITPENKQIAMLLGYLKQKDGPILNYYMNYSQMRKHSKAFVQIGEQELIKIRAIKMQNQRY